MKTLHRSFAALALFSIFTLAHADFESGLAAYNKKDYAGALAQWEPLIDKGDARATKNVAAMYLLGQGVKPDADKAVELLNKAIALKDPEAMRIMGQMYIDGRNPKLMQNAPAGNVLMARAAALGDTAAEYYMGKLMLATDKRDLGLGYLANAANHGHKGAAIALGQIFETGNGVPANQEEADKWYGLAGGKPDWLKKPKP